MSRANIFSAVSTIARLVMAVVWISAGISKMGSLAVVKADIEAYQIFTAQWSSILAVLIGPLELVAGILLLVGFMQPQVAKVTNIVLVLFIIGIAQAWIRGLEIDCGCFGAGNSDPNRNFPLEYAWVIIRDIGFIALTTWLIYRPDHKFSVDRLLGGTGTRS